MLNGGLCATCNNAPTCMYRGTRGPALFCETFDGYAAAGERTAVRPESSVPATAAAAGLCANCVNLESCMHVKPAGGVWHCEDYE
jgi:hypothetical protein